MSLPTIGKLADDVLECFNTPMIAAGKMAISEGGKKVGQAAQPKLTDKKLKAEIAKCKANLRIPHANDDLATVAAITEYVYKHLVNMKIAKASNRMALARAGKMAEDDESSPFVFPINWLVDRNAVLSADQDLDVTIARIQKFRILFDGAFLGCAAAIFGVGVMDIKSLASSFSSLVAGDAMLVQHVKKRSEQGVEVCDRCLLWAGKRNQFIDEFLHAHDK